MALERATKSDIPKSRRWHRDAVFEVERARVVNFIAAAARENLRKPEPTKEKAAASAPVLVAEIGGLMAPSHDIRDPDIIKSVSNGVYERAAPSLTSIWFFRFLTVVAATVEIGIFAAQWLSGDAHPAVLILGTMLALSGYLIGLGIGRMSRRRDLDEEQEGQTLNKVFIVTGLIGIALSVYIRVAGSPDGAVLAIALTVLVALLVAVFEALYEYTSHRYQSLWQKQYQGQQWIAEKHHLGDMNRGFWKLKYLECVGDIATNTYPERQQKDDDKTPDLKSIDPPNVPA